MNCSSFTRFTRRQWIQATALAAFAPAVFPAEPAQGPVSRKPPYLALAPFIEPGHDEFTGEKAAEECKAALRKAFQDGAPLRLTSSATGSSPFPRTYRDLAEDLSEAVFDPQPTLIQEGWLAWRKSLGDVRRIQFYVLPDNLVRYEVASTTSQGLTYRVGFWKLIWNNGYIEHLSPVREHVARSKQPWFRDITGAALAADPNLHKQFRCGVPYWRSRLDPASGIDIYGSNGIAVGDVDGDGLDEVYVCQPGGLPNRLLKISPDGHITDLTAKWNVGLLDDTSCALFLDLRNTGKQDLVVLRSSGPVLFVHQGDHYQLRTDAFEFARTPKGGFTGMAAADYDCDGKLDLYLCCYVYFQSEAQYTYATPYHDAQNGPPNFLFRNNLAADGSGAFTDVTQSTGVDENNNRFSFAPAWCDYDGDGWPDLYVANDFGRKNLYRNQNGQFRDVAKEARVEDIGPGMSAAWFDYDHDGRPDLYVANMWTEAGQRVIADTHFKPASVAPEAYKGHTMGNSLFHNNGNGTFADTSERENVSLGRWAWSAGGHDLDNDGNAEIYTTCGMLTNTSQTDLSSFFWRQVVAQSPTSPTRSSAYENGWNAINQFIREDLSWNGHEPNVLHVRRGNTHFDFSGVSGLDFADDSRAFAVFDFDGDGQPDVLLKSRLGPQIRLLQNSVASGKKSLTIALQGTKSNRDGIGAKVCIGHQTKWVEAGSGFLSQHSKRLIFGLGSEPTASFEGEIVWPSGLRQALHNLQPGYAYTVIEAKAEPVRAPLRAHSPLAESPLEPDNSLKLEDTRLLQPVPLPSRPDSAGLLVVREATAEWEIFRRYLFDWRANLETPFALSLNENREAVAVYKGVPTNEQVALQPLPFPGFYIKPPKRDFFKWGAAYLWAGMYDQALPYLERVLVQSPENARVLVLVAQIHLEQNRVDEAAKAFAQATQLDPTSANAHIGLGDIAAQHEQNDLAQREYAAALQLDPDSPEASNGLGLALAKQGQFGEAQRYFEQAISHRRDYAEAINNLAVLFSRQDKRNDAIAAWNYGIQVCPSEAILYMNLGRAYVQAGQFDKARYVMQELLDHDSTNQAARRALQELSNR